MADEDTVCDVVHAFNQEGLAALDPRWAVGRPRLICEVDIEFIVMMIGCAVSTWLSECDERVRAAATVPDQ